MSTVHDLDVRCVICATDTQIRAGQVPLSGRRDTCPYWPEIELRGDEGRPDNPDGTDAA